MKDKATQDFLKIKQIREGVVILKNKSMRSVLMVSSLNFALKSEEEQTATIYQFQNFLNSMDFGCQIIVQSRKLNITGYIEKLKELEKAQRNELLQIQTTGYREFIEGLVKTGTIMSKTFFLVIPFSTASLTSSTIKSEKKPVVSDLTEELFRRSKAQLWQRMEFVVLGLRKCGLKAVPLTTGELIELFWALHHPKQAEIGYYPEIPPELST